MITLPSLQATMDYIRTKHKSMSKDGANAMKFVRKPDGSRIMFEEIVGFRNMSSKIIEPNNLIITQFVSGFSFKGKDKINSTSRLFLSDLAVINIYDHSTEFFSSGSIDFVYVENDRQTEIELLDEMFSGQPFGHNLRAQWVWNDPVAEQILKEIDSGRTMTKMRTDYRDIDLSLDI